MWILEVRRGTRPWTTWQTTSLLIFSIFSVFTIPQSSLDWRRYEEEEREPGGNRKGEYMNLMISTGFYLTDNLNYRIKKLWSVTWYGKLTEFRKPLVEQCFARKCGIC